jgi:hypothetical protein
MVRKWRYGRRSLGFWAAPELIERIDRNRGEEYRAHFIEKLLTERLNDIENGVNGAATGTNRTHQPTPTPTKTPTTTREVPLVER